MTTIIYVAGLFNSLDGHWQRLWYEKLPDGVWVEQTDWGNPDRDSWVAELEKVISSTPGNKILVAHSIGCSTVAEWAVSFASKYEHGVKGALLVGIPDVHGPNFPEMITGYDNVPSGPLPFPSIAVASSDDPYASVTQSEHIAKQWGANLVLLKDKGHINDNSGLGDWPQGQELLSSFY